jgi:hypothetical protein
VPAPPRNPGYLGVRLSDEELRMLDELVSARGFAHRSDAIRRLLREASEPPAPSPAPAHGTPLTVPVSLARELEREVDDGWALTPEEALAKALELGLGELARQREERRTRSRESARQLQREETDRKGATRAGRRYTGA